MHHRRGTHLLLLLLPPDSTSTSPTLFVSGVCHYHRGDGVNATAVPAAGLHENTEGNKPYTPRLASWKALRLREHLLLLPSQALRSPQGAPPIIRSHSRSHLNLLSHLPSLTVWDRCLLQGVACCHFASGRHRLGQPVPSTILGAVNHHRLYLWQRRLLPLPSMRPLGSLTSS